MQDGGLARDITKQSAEAQQWRSLVEALYTNEHEY